MVQNKKKTKQKTQKEIALELIKLMPDSIEWSDINSIFYEKGRLEKTLNDAFEKGILTKKEALKRYNMLDKTIITDWLKNKYGFE